ncbi:Ankyrin repeat-containing domain protein [Elaphomyces granulatus]
MPLSIPNLPTEILLEITYHLGDATMNALTLTNSELYNLPNGRLYRRDVIRSQSRSLTWAAKNGVGDTIQRAIDARPHFNPIPESFHIALQVAVDQGHVHLIRLLLKVDGINPNFAGGPFQTAPLSLAVREGRVGLLKLPATNFIIRPTKAASHYVEAAKLLLEREDIDINLPDNKGYTAFSWACQNYFSGSSENNYVEMVKLLLNRRNIDLNVMTPSGFTALMLALKSWRPDGVVRLLLGHKGINVNQRDRGLTDLHVAVYLGTLKAAELLLEREDIDINLPDNSGWTPLFFACSPYDLPMTKLLLDRPDIDVNRQNNEGHTALCHVISRNNLKAAKHLLEREDIDINLPDNNGWTPLFFACSYYDLPIAKLLLDHPDIDVNRQNDEGRTALCHAISRNNLNAAKLLLEREDIDINRPDNNGCTALFWACSIGDDAYRVGNSVAIVGLLLSHRDTDPNAVNDNGDSVFAHFMRHRGFIDSHEASEIEFLLQKAGSM